MYTPIAYGLNSFFSSKYVSISITPILSNSIFEFTYFGIFPNLNKCSLYKYEYLFSFNI